MSTKDKVAANTLAKPVASAKTMILGSQQTEELRDAVKQALASRDMATMVMDARALGLPVLEQAPERPRFDPLATTVVDSHAHALDGQTPLAAAAALLALPRAPEPRTERRRARGLDLRGFDLRRLGLAAAAVGVLGLAGAYASFAKPVRRQPTAAHIVRPAAGSQPAATAWPPAQAKAPQLAAAATPQLAAAATPQLAAAATPQLAARAFALGDEDRALAHYRELARQYPEERSYALMVSVLTARQRSDSRD